MPIKFVSAALEVHPAVPGTPVTLEDLTKQASAQVVKALQANPLHPVQSIAQHIAKAKSSAKPKAKSETQLAVEEMIDLHIKLDASHMLPVIKRMDELKKLLSGAISDSAADPLEPFTFFGPGGATITYGPCAKSVVVKDVVAVEKKLGHAVFLKLAKIGITDLKTYLSGIELESLTKTVPGARSLKSINAADFVAATSGADGDT